MYLKRIKDKLYYYFAEKNWGVRREYGPYVQAHLEEHQKARWKHWWLLIKLNWHYRVLRRTDYLILKIDNDKSKIIKPYQDGPESKKSQRIAPYHFAASLMEYDVISFDIFDTLILRKLDQPEDVFMIVGEKLNVYNFLNIRKKAESEVRQRKRALFNNNEVTLDEIYDRVSYYTGIDPKLGAEVEFQVECDLCFANPYMLQVFQILKSSGKRIFATSNMYIPKEKMVQLLKKCGYEGFEDVLVSCDYQCGKGNGELFNVLKGKLEKNLKIIHIGDNMAADVKGAMAAGIESRYYPACRTLGNPHRSPGMSPLIGSAYRAIVNTTLHNGIQTYSALWEYGFVYGGLIAAGYVNWIHQEAIKDGVSKILFLSRDGFILKKVYDLFFNDIPSDYVYWSRIAALRNVCPSEREPFLTRLFGERCNTGDTIEDILQLGGILDLKPLFVQNGLDPKLPITSDNLEHIWDLLVENWEKVEQSLSKIQEATNRYLKNIVNGYQKIALVELGWSGKNLGPLVKAFERCGIDTRNVKIYMLGSIVKNQNAVQMLDGTISCYMFNAHYNRMIHDRFCSESTRGLEIVEKLFSAPHNSFLGFDNLGQMEFCLPEADNYSAFYEIEAGILDFCQRYYEAFRNYPYLLNIPGYDAFIPIRLLFNNKEIANQIIGALSYNKGISPYDRRRMNELFGGKQ